MQKVKFQVEQKRSKVLKFPGQQEQTNLNFSQEKIINFIQNQGNNLQQKKNCLPTAFYISLISLEGALYNQIEVDYDLIKTLVQSYQIIIDDLGQSQDGMQLYFQSRINYILNLPQAEKIVINRKKLGQSVCQDLQKMIESSTQKLNVIQEQLIQEEEQQIEQIDQIQQDNNNKNLKKKQAHQRNNSLINYLGMQQKLFEEEEKAKQIIQEYDNTIEQNVSILENQLKNQSDILEQRLVQRNNKLKSGNQQQQISEDFMFKQSRIKESSYEYQD